VSFSRASWRLRKARRLLLTAAEGALSASADTPPDMLIRPATNLTDKKARTASDIRLAGSLHRSPRRID
jgi:hypothetical protein